MSYKTYGKYKKSSIDWINEIPNQWKINKLKILLDKITDGSHSSVELVNEGYPYVTVTDLNEINEYVDIDNCKRISKKDYDSLVRNGCKPTIGDILFSQIGTIGLVVPVDNYDDYVLLSSVAILSASKNIHRRWLIHFLKSPVIKNQWKQLLAGGAVKRITLQHIVNFTTIVPPLEEQKQIANYLDKQTTIDATIAKNEELIRLLEEKRVALINQVITKGLNPDVVMKDSGVEWIGEIPEHWDMLKISNIFNNIGSGTTPKSSNDEYYNEGNVNWLITGDLNDNYIYNTSTKITKKALHDTPSLKIYPKYSLVIAMYGATIGKLGILNIETCTNQACCVLSRSNTMNIKYAYYWFLGYRNEIISLSYGGGQPNISQDVIKNIKCIVPPFIEQQQIIDYLDSEITKINETITKVTENINLLEEYKTSLIHHVVTGKIDVRGEEI